MNLTDKVAVVTGANGDQGRAVVTAYLKNGARVVAVDINYDDAFDSIAADSGDVAKVACDISDPQAIESVRDALGPFGRCDILYNNAALYLPGRGDGDASVVELDVWNRVLAVNITGVMHMVRAVLPTMTDQGSGVIINVGSVAAVLGSHNIAYASSKGAMLAFTKSMAVTHGPLGIRSVAMSLGPVDTQMMSHAKADAEEWQRFLETVPLKRAATAEEIAQWAVFLATDAASFANGANFVIDGGRVLNVG